MQSKTLVNGFGLIILLSAILVTALGAKGCEPLQGTSNNPPAGGYLSGSSVKLPVIWNVAAEAIASDKIFINCDSAYSGGTKFRIERKTNTSDYRLVATANGPEYEDTGLTPTTTYSYRIKAVGPDNVQSDYSNEASATTLNPSDRDRPHQHQIDSGSSNQQRAQTDQVSSAEPELDAVAEFLFSKIEDLPAPLPTGYAFLGGGDLLLTSEETWNRSQNFPPGKEHAAYIILPRSVRAEELSQADIKLMEFIDGSWVIVHPDKKGKLHTTGPKAGYIGPDESAPARVTGPRPWAWVIVPQVTTINTATTITNTNQTEITGIPAVTVSTYSNITITGTTAITPDITSPVTDSIIVDMPVTPPISTTIYQEPVTWTQMNPTTTPSARHSHSMTYDSIRRKIILFGGHEGSKPLDDTWEWDGTNWTQLNPSNKPLARYQHKMVSDLARGKIVLFGGHNGTNNGILNDTWEWDGTNWVLMNPISKPLARFHHAMAYDSARGKVVLFGGVTLNVTQLSSNDTWEWDGSNWSLRNPSTKPLARDHHVMAYNSAHSKTVLFGGQDSSNNRIQDTWEWDGTNWVLMNPSTNPATRYIHEMVYDERRDKIVLFGGALGNYDNGWYAQDTWEWDGIDWIEINPTTKPLPRGVHAMAYDLARAKTVLFGGWSAAIVTIFQDTWEYPYPYVSPVTPPISPTVLPVVDTTAPSVPTGLGATTVSPYQINLTWNASADNVAVTGYKVYRDGMQITTVTSTSYSDTSLNPSANYSYTVTAYDGAGNISVQSSTLSRLYLGVVYWIVISNISTLPAPDTIAPSIPTGLTAMTASSSQINLSWNTSTDNVGVAGYLVYRNGTFVTITPSNSYSNMELSPSTNYNYTVTACDASGNTSAQSNSINVSTLSPPDTAPPTTPTGLIATAVSSCRINLTWNASTDNLPDGQAGVGVVGYKVYRDGILIAMVSGEDGSTDWAQKNSINKPSVRYGHTMTYDVKRNRTLLFGGFEPTTNLLGDTWEWDGTDWRQLSTTTQPSPRFAHAMAYDFGRGKTVLFGGANNDGSGHFQDTWEWDGTNWTEKNPINKPSARNTTMIYDSARGKTLLFGGESNGSYFQDTWEWDGSNWKQLTPATQPSPRTSHKMAYDSGRGKIVLFGGWNSINHLDDTWEWDGINWTQRNPANKPSGRSGHALVYDVTRGKVFLFGGQETNLAGNILQDIWEYDGTDWTKIIAANIPPIRELHAMVFDLAQRKTVLFGGFQGIIPPLQDTWQWPGNPVYKDTDLNPVTTYSYAVAAYDNVGNTSAYSNMATAVTLPPPETITPPISTTNLGWVEKIAQGAAGSPSSRRDHSMVWDEKRVIMFGGGWGGVNDLWWYEPGGNSWYLKISPGASGSPPPRNDASMVWDGIRVIMFGGYWGDSDNYIIYNDVWWYDPNTNTWAEKIANGNPSSPSPRGEHSMVWDGQRVIMFGGASGGLDYTCYHDLWWYDPKTNTWTQKIADGAAGSPSRRWGHSMVWDGQRVIMLGGYAPGIYYVDSYGNDLWWYTPATNTWTQRIAYGSAGSPPGRYDHSMIWNGKEVIMFGGRPTDINYNTNYGNDEYNDIWGYTPGINTWGRKILNGATGSPPKRWGHSMVWDGANVIIFGGWSGGLMGNLKNDLWWYSPDDSPRWAQVAAGSGYTTVIKNDSTLWAWGGNDCGQLGIGDTIDRNTPSQVGTDSNWTQVDCGYYRSAAIKDNCTLWVWGYNWGQLGLGDNIHRYTPTQVGTDTNWAQVTVGKCHTLAIKTDGSLWTWGYNSSGQLGLGDTTNRSVPIRVCTDTNWKQITAGNYHSVALKNDGTLWVWGNNLAGQLGLGDTANRNIPTQIGSDTKWAQIAAGDDYYTLAVKTDGALWAWGWNGHGQLGLGDTISRTTPSQVGTDTNWVQVTCGGYHSLALKNDGTLWGWGNNLGGQLGVGDNIIKNTPIQVGRDTNWVGVAGGGGHTIAIKIDDSLWICGQNTHGQLGLGDTTDRLVPTQVGQ